MNSETGIIEKINKSTTGTGKPRFGILINEKWYNSWGEVPAELVEGVKIKIEYETNSYGNQIKKVFKTDENDIMPAMEGNKEHQIKVKEISDFKQASEYKPREYEDKSERKWKQRIISRLACLNTATEIVKFSVENGWKDTKLTDKSIETIKKIIVSVANELEKYIFDESQ